MSGRSCSETEVSTFQQTVRDYYLEHRRSLPWRETRDPYAILVSEIMLQQTRVERVRVKYQEFLQALPGFADLAVVDLPTLLSLWQGLGYNRRAVSLRSCAVAVMERFGGALPGEISELETLPGIGPYTARAVAAFAFNQAAAFIETNIRSVFIHHFFPDAEAVHDREILPLVERTLDKQAPRDWYYALMDYGAMLKKKGVNPSRRSVHHARQSPFRGSNREQRSMILLAVLASPGVTGAEVMRAIAGEAGVIEVNLEQLQREGFLREECGRYWICR